MSMIGKNCQWVIVFSHTVLILLYLLSENTQFIDVIHVFTSCNNVAPVTNLCLGRVSEHLGFYY